MDSSGTSIHLVYSHNKKMKKHRFIPMRLHFNDSSHFIWILIAKLVSILNWIYNIFLLDERNRWKSMVRFTSYLLSFFLIFLKLHKNCCWRNTSIFDGAELSTFTCETFTVSIRFHIYHFVKDFLNLIWQILIRSEKFNTSLLFHYHWTTAWLESIVFILYVSTK